MNSINIKINKWVSNDLKEFIRTQNGIIDCNIDIDKDCLDIVYDNDKISLNIIYNYLKLFLDTKDVPFIISFNKNIKGNIIEKELIVDDICCEYCYMGRVEYLFKIDGLDRLESNYDFNNFKDVKIKIFYDKNKIDDNYIEEIIDELKKN